MKWLIQDSLTWDALDRNVKPLITALQELNIPYAGIGVIPFTDIVTGLEEQDPNLPTIFYGGTKLLKIQENWSTFRPGAFYKTEWFDPKNWINKRDDLLNENIKVITIKNLKDNWIKLPSFIKPISVKDFPGQVIETDEHKEWMEEYSELDPNIELVISPIHIIEREWRFFIVNGEIASGSLYKKFGCRITKEPISEEVYSQANAMAKKWLPSPNIVMDICQLRSGTYKVVEFNSLSAAGFYNCNVKDIVKSINR